MKTKLLLLFLYSSLSVAFAQDACAPVGWATYNYTVTGGGSATPVVVSTYNDLKTQLSGNISNKVIYISGTIIFPDGGRIENKGSNVTVCGYPGARLVNTTQTSSGSGILSFSGGATNIIIRNLIFEGPGAYDCDGRDNLSLYGCKNVWVDHCTFQDGIDGNFDITNASDMVSVTWCKFEYLKPAKPGGPGGSNDHRLTNLIGGGDTSTSDIGKLNITFQYCWWAEGCKSRMPRVRFGKVHLANCFFNSSVADANVYAGFDASCRVEACYFKDQPAVKAITYGATPTINSAVEVIDCKFVNSGSATNQVSGKTGTGAYFTPPYSLTLAEVDNVPMLVSAGAGATMPAPNSCTGTTQYVLTTSTAGTGVGTVTLNPVGGVYAPGTVVQLTANATSGTFTSWSGDATGTTNPVSITMDGTKSVTANFLAAPTYTLTINNAGTGLGSVTLNPAGGNYALGTIVTITANSYSGSTFDNWSGDLSGTTNPASVTMDGNKTVTANFGGSSAVKRIAYVTDPLNAAYVNDTKILPALKAEPGFVVTEITGTQSGIDYSNYDMVLFSEVLSSAAAGVSELKGLNKPFLMMKVHAYKTAVGAWNWIVPTTAYGQDATQTNIVVSNPVHAVFNAPYPVSFINTNEVSVLSAVTNSKGLTFADPTQFASVSGGTISTLATVKGSLGTTQAVILEIPANTTVAGTLIPQKFVQIGVNSASSANLTSDGVKLVLNACYYLMGVSFTSVNDIIASQVQVYPTIADNLLSIKLLSGKYNAISIRVFNTNGVEVMSANSGINTNNQLDMNISNLCKGLYFVRIQVDDVSYNSKFIKR